MTKKYIITQSQIDEISNSTWQDGFAILHSLKPVEPMKLDERMFLYERNHEKWAHQFQEKEWFQAGIFAAEAKHFGELK